MCFQSANACYLFILSEEFHMCYKNSIHVYSEPLTGPVDTKLFRIKNKSRIPNCFTKHNPHTSTRADFLIVILYSPSNLHIEIQVICDQWSYVTVLVNHMILCTYMRSYYGLPTQLLITVTDHWSQFDIDLLFFGSDISIVWEHWPDTPEYIIWTKIGDTCVYNVLYSVVTTSQTNPLISQFNGPCNEFMSVWSMFLYNRCLNGN